MPLFSACCNREGKIIWGVSANRDSGRRNDVPSLPVPLSSSHRRQPAALRLYLTSFCFLILSFALLIIILLTDSVKCLLTDME